MKYSFVSAIVVAALAVNNSINLVQGRPTTTGSSMMNGMLNKADIPDSGKDWITLPNGVQFQPSASDGAEEQDEQRLDNLRKLAWNGFSSNTGTDTGFYQPFVDGTETMYDEYAQAWRLLGWYIDCDSCDGGDDDGQDGGGDDYSTCWTFRQYNGYEDNQEDGDNDNQNENRSGCQRYLVWAAYVDLDYEGYGVHEYMYYDRKNNKWNDDSCKNVGNLEYDGQDNGDNDEDWTSYLQNLNPFYGKARCVKMDCHLQSTHFKLLGIFKEPHYDEFMEQLFKHQGDCVWDDEEYQLMQVEREAWPNGCTVSQTHVTNDGGYIYYDLKPDEYGRMDIGLYTDDSCVEDYDGEFTVEDVLIGAGYEGYEYTYVPSTNGDDRQDNDQVDCGNNEQNDWGCTSILSLNEEINAWNDAFDVFKQCMPCKTSLLVEIVAGKGLEYNSTGTRQYWNDAREDNGNDDQDEADDYNFHCKDDAGYDNVNQCMKFATHTKMLTATYKDVEAAGRQNTITQFAFGGDSNMKVGNNRPTYVPNFGDSHDFSGQSVNSHNRRIENVKIWIAPTLAFIASLICLGYGYGKYVRASRNSMVFNQQPRRYLERPLV